MKLAIISHTEHYLVDGQILGLGPTVREINHLASDFEEIWHIAALHSGPAPASALPYASDKIHFVPIRPSGGEGIREKLQVLLQIPAVLNVILRTLRHVDVFQFRAPTGIGNFVIPWLCLFSQKKGWYKYAGNWVQKNPPLGYRWQRWWLASLQKRPVTINGHWPAQAAHLWSFENPCLTELELTEAYERSKNKNFDGELILCFVGSLSPNKGVQFILEALGKMDQILFDRVLIAGDGPLKSSLSAQTKTLPIPVELLGYQSRTQLNACYSKAHFILLPSENEGFPKVVAEAAAHGCIPIVTDVSCIGQYVMEGKNGFLLEDNSSKSMQEKFEKIRSQQQHFKAYSEAVYRLAKAFTYERYSQRIHEMLGRTHNP